MRPLFFLALPLALLSLLSRESRSAETAQPPKTQSAENLADRSLEPIYADALLAAHDKNYDKAFQILSQILNRDPNYFQALELKALILKNLGKPEEARPIYEKLMKIAGADIKAQAPYHFELGVLDYNAKKDTEAHAHLQQALAGRFNIGVTQFLLGTLDLKSGDWHAAQNRFERVVVSDANAVKPIAHLYLAQITANNRNTIETIRHLREAQKVDDGLNSNSIEYDFTTESKAWIDQARSEDEQALKDLNHSKYFGSVTLLAGFDTNVLSAPASTDIQGTPSNYASPGATLKGAIGYAGAPLESFQTVTSYQFSVNMETSSATKTGQFFTHDLSVYLNHAPFEVTSYGFKLEGIGIFQFEDDPLTNKGSFSPYSLQGSFGPYYRREIKKYTNLGVELMFEPRHDYLDSAFSPNERQSGYDVLFRPYISYDPGNVWWNPTFSLTATETQTSGLDYISKSLALNFMTLSRLSQKTRLSTTLELGMASFPDRLGETRSDHFILIDESLNVQLNPRLSFLADLQYNNNKSNITTIYQYTRLIASVGLSYAL